MPEPPASASIWAANIQLSGFRITNFSGAGISINGGTVSITGNTIGSSAVTGILVNNGNVTIQNNFVQNNAVGIDVASGATGSVAVHKNSITSINSGSTGLVNHSGIGCRCGRQLVGTVARSREHAAQPESLGRSGISRDRSNARPAGQQCRRWFACHHRLAHRWDRFRCHNQRLPTC